MTNDIIGFKQAMRAAEIEPPGEIIINGKIHRFDVNEDKRGSQNGWYILFPDPLAGAFGCWKRSIKEVWSARKPSEMSAEERVRYSKQQERAKSQSEEELNRRHAGCRAWCAENWPRFQEATDDHPYLRKKGVPSYGLRESEGSLVVPIQDIYGTMHGVQFITPEGGKQYSTGLNKGGHFYIIPGKEDIIVICEGYATGASIYFATGYTVIIAFDAGNLIPVGQNIQVIYPKGDIIFAADDDWKTAGNLGLTKAFEAAQAVYGKIAVPHLPAHRKEKDTDFNDLHLLSGLKAVKMCIDGAASWRERIPNDQFTGLYNTSIKRLAGLSPSEYALNRKKEAGGLGVSVNLLDKEVKAARNNGEEKLPFTVYSPCSEPVNPANLLGTVADTIKSYVICPQEIIDAAALWAVFTWFAQYTSIAPYLFITSPEKECGKSTFKDAIKVLSYRPIEAGNITPAGLFRVIELYSPTLFIDEGDAFLNDNEAMRGILNAGHKRGTPAIRMGGINRDQVELFDTFGPKCIVAIKRIPETIESRSIILRMERKLGSDEVKSFPYMPEKIEETFGPLCSQLARFAADYHEQFKDLLEKEDFPTPKGVYNRARNNWGVLFTIAKIAGSGWPDRICRAAQTLLGVKDETISTSLELLADVYRCFQEKGVQGLTTREILEWLNGDDENGSPRRWAAFNHGKGLNSRNLGKVLGGYQIFSDTIHSEGSKNAKGYKLENIQSKYERYSQDEVNSEDCSSGTNEEAQGEKSSPPRYEFGDDVLVSEEDEPE